MFIKLILKINYKKNNFFNYFDIKLKEMFKVLLIIVLIIVICMLLNDNNMMKKCENNSLIIHENVDYNDLYKEAIYCFILEENLIYFDIGLPRNHWEIGLLINDKDGFLISTSSHNCIEVFKAQYDGKHFKYGYKNKLDTNARIISMSTCKSIKVIDVLRNELERIKKHPYKLLYDNCHNNALYQYLNIISETPPKELINIVNKKNGFRLFL